mmetsp:Transcript_80321/g.245514  ORF Transcript_80321/g.245514 Transcript_80321/m.245514 type:complete len:348 (+) Transcript_80321:385-1428(+)
MAFTICCKAPPSKAGRPKLMSGLSMPEGLLPLVVFDKPLLAAQSIILRLLSSTYCGLLSRNPSNHLNVPSSGYATGSITSHLPSLGTTDGAKARSSLAAEPRARHAKGSGLRGAAPRFTCTVKLRKETCGKRALPLRLSGSAWGCETRSPSRKRLTVLACGLAESRFSNTATVVSLPNGFDALVLVFAAWKKPSESKRTCASSSAPKISDEPAAEKPTRTNCTGLGALPHAWAPTGIASMTFTSYMYRPACTPALARAPARRNCMPPSARERSNLPPKRGTTLRVVSEGWKQMASFAPGRLSAGASASSTKGSAGAAAAAGSSPLGAVFASLGAGSSALAFALAFLF